MYNFMCYVNKFFRHKSEAFIDNIVFRFHYKITVLLLMVCFGMVTAVTYFGSPINCKSDGPPEHVVNTYCWISTTFTVVSNKNKGDIQSDIGTYNENVDEIKHHKYYQWISFLLFTQAILFYFPHFLWKHMEGGRINCLSRNLRVGLENEEIINARHNLLCDFFDNNNRKTHSSYIWRYVMCELLNLLNIFMQMWMIYEYLGKEFLTYGIDIFRQADLDYSLRTDKMSRIFPKVTKCNYRDYGHSGEEQKFDALCILSLNTVNEKIYIILWFWFLFIGTITMLSIIYRLLTFIPYVRKFIMKRKFTSIPNAECQLFCDKFTIGNWFIFCKMGQNVEELDLLSFVPKLRKRFNISPNDLNSVNSD